MLTLKRSIAITLCLFLGACGGKVELLKDIAEAEANEAIAVLLEAGIASSKMPGKDGFVSLEVEQVQVAKAIDILNAEGLPRERFARMGDVFRKEGLISSPLEERARYIWALSQELSATLAQIDGVIKARVHVVLPEKSTGGDPALPSSASVFIKHKQGVQLEDSVPQIKRLVSNSIPGLSAEKVTVVMLPSSGRSSANVGSREVVADRISAIRTAEEQGKATLSASNVPIWMYTAMVATAFLFLLAGAALWVWKRWRLPKADLARPVPEKS